MARGFSQRVEFGVHVRIRDTRKGSNGLWRKKQAEGGWWSWGGQGRSLASDSGALALSSLESASFALWSPDHNCCLRLIEDLEGPMCVEGLTNPDSASEQIMRSLNTGTVHYPALCAKGSLRPSQWAGHPRDLMRTTSGAPNHFLPKLINKLKFL